MRTAVILLLGLLTGACSSMIDQAPYDVGQQPNQSELDKGIAIGIQGSKFANPIEVTDVLRARVNSFDPWMVCLRSGTSDAAKLVTYSVFWSGNYGDGKGAQYKSSQNSAFIDDCNAQTYHAYQAPPSPKPAVVPQPQASADIGKRKHRR
jgi:hypothetical protein